MCFYSNIFIVIYLQNIKKKLKCVLRQEILTLQDLSQTFVLINVSLL